MQKVMQKKDRRFRSRKNGHFTVAGSVTVEAALVLPLFIFFSFMLFSVFDMISTYCRFQSALTETAAEAAVLLYAKEDSMPDKEESFLLAETFIREEITRKTAKTLGGSVVEWDALGLHLFRSDMADESGNVRLILTYVVKPWFSIGGVFAWSILTFGPPRPRSRSSRGAGSRRAPWRAGSASRNRRTGGRSPCAARR